MAGHKKTHVAIRQFDIEMWYYRYLDASSYEKANEVMYNRSSMPIGTIVVFTRQGES
jgi:hypothetical protein